MKVVLLENASWVKWVWKEEELKQIKEMHEQGLNPNEIAKQLKEYPDNVGLAIIHLENEKVGGNAW